MDFKRMDEFNPNSKFISTDSFRSFWNISYLNLSRDEISLISFFFLEIFIKRIRIWFLGRIQLRSLSDPSLKIEQFIDNSRANLNFIHDKLEA